MHPTMMIMMMTAMMVSLEKTSATADCKARCDSLVGELPQALDCRNYRMMLPRPKVGKACTSAYDDAASTACYSKCQGDSVPSRDAKSADFCRKYLQDYPKPTVHKSCKTGYNLGFDKGLQAASTLSQQSEGTPVNAPPQQEQAPPNKLRQQDDETNAAAAADASSTKMENDKEPSLLVSMPVTVDDAEINLKVYSGEDADQRVASFCAEHMSDSVDSCVRQLTPHVQRKIVDATAAAAAADK